ncbi:MAG TPA: signal recognition particle-docking protein FtsY [Nitrososphaerales archaeon]|nr:signal recognition particle-docking protein FtsY [Nitrososphaerales archaeon]
MFEKLRSAFGALSKLATHASISEKEIDASISDLEMSLIESDVASEVVESITSNLKNHLLGSKIPRSEDKQNFIASQLMDSIRALFALTPKVDLIAQIRSKLQRNVSSEFEPFVVLFLGINGTGKTTSVSKIAYLLKGNGFSVVLAAGDTHRAGAIEQISEHASRLKLKIITQSYNSDPAAVAKDAQLYAISHKVDVALVDSAGRMQTSKNLMEEMQKIVRVVKPDMKIFVADSLAGNDALSQAKEFKKFTDFDAAILTKADADVKGGAALSIAYVTQRPIIYLGVGQEYSDLEPFDIEHFIESLLG